MGERAERDACNTSVPDWEVLSVSMSASTFSSPNPNPNPNSSSATTGDNPAPKSLFKYPVLDDTQNPNSSPDYDSDLDSSNCTNPLHAAVSSDGANKLSTHLHVHDGRHGCDEESFCYLHIDAEPLLEEGPCMVGSPEVTTQAAEAEKAILLQVPLTNAGAYHTPKKRSSRSWSVKVVWTIAVAVMIVGIGMLERRVQAENRQLQLELSIKDEKLDGLTRQVNSLKEVVSRHYTTRSSIF